MSKKLIAAYEDFVDQQTNKRKEKRKMTIYKLEWSIPSSTYYSLTSLLGSGTLAATNTAASSLIGGSSGTVNCGSTWPYYSSGASGSTLNVEYYLEKSKAEAKMQELKNAAGILKLGIYPTISELPVIE